MSVAADLVIEKEGSLPPARDGRKTKRTFDVIDVIDVIDVPGILVHWRDRSLPWRRHPTQIGPLPFCMPCTSHVALAELTGAILVTGDERITASPGTRCEIQIIK